MKKIPLRKCMGCNEQKPKSELVRIVRTTEGKIAVDRTGKLNGRGAYICSSSACLAKVRKSRRLDKLLETSVPEEVYDELEKEISSGE